MKQCILFCTALLLLMISCKKESTSPDFVDMPVVAAYLRVGDTARLNVSRLTPFATNATYSSDDINHLQIAITSNSVTYQLQATGNGNYIASNPLLKIDQASGYSLSFNYNGKNVSAYTTIPTKPTGFTESVNSFTLAKITPTTSFSSISFPDPVTLTWTNNDNSYYLIVVENMEAYPDTINTKNPTQATRIFKNPPVQTNTYQLRSNQFHFFGQHRIILYHLNADYAALYINNNNSSNNLTNTQSSVTNGTGIFTGINADTLLFQVYKSP
ncbi:MAG: hypothetical protein ACXVPQ_01900 [Bacteroidia bacterium]